MKKLKIMIILIILAFSFFLLSYSKARNYELTYNKNGFEIIEKYIKKDKNYLITVKYNKKNYNFIISDKYHKSRKLVNKVKKYKSDDITCIEISFNKKDMLPICTQNEEFISYYLTPNAIKNKVGIKKYKNEIKKNKFSYKNIDVNYLNNKRILVWNYHGFYYLDNKIKKSINIVNNDVYNPLLVGQIDNYLVVPNYDQGYEYRTLKVINIDNLDITKLEIKDSLSNESYILGTNDKSIFIFDQKYKRELELVPYKLKYRFVDPLIYENGKLISKSSTYLSNNKVEFVYDTMYDYNLKDNRLYKTNKYNNDKILLTDKNVKEIVKKSNDEVYYLVNNSLYMYSDKYGEVLILQYFELDFNYKNIIYIFD